MALDNQSPSGGPFSLASYTNLSPVEQVSLSDKPADPANWNRIEISYSKTHLGNIKHLAASNGLSSSDDLNYHFVICNGSGETDGLIQATDKWRMQRPCLAGGNWYGTGRTIRVCVIGDGLAIVPTDCQVRRAVALTEALSRKFNVSNLQIHYPGNWQM
jgi:hypothetical protein